MSKYTECGGCHEGKFLDPFGSGDVLPCQCRQEAVPAEVVLRRLSAAVQSSSDAWSQATDCPYARGRADALRWVLSLLSRDGGG